MNEELRRREKIIETVARMWMKCDPNRGGSDPDEIMGLSYSASASADGVAIDEGVATPLTGKPRWHWFIPRAEASLKFLEENGIVLKSKDTPRLGTRRT